MATSDILKEILDKNETIEILFTEGPKNLNSFIGTIENFVERFPDATNLLVINGEDVKRVKDTNELQSLYN
jgi:hypothetical protein